MEEELLVLVDAEDKEVGLMEKMEVHRCGLLHRAFSVLLYNEQGEMLLQQRALLKYHGGGLWTNACCSHPKPGEKLEDAVNRRLKEELGLTSDCRKIHHFIYRAELDNGLIEHEFDYIFVGLAKDTPQINEEEVADWKFVNVGLLKKDIQNYPQHYTPWFKLIMEQMANIPDIDLSFLN